MGTTKVIEETSMYHPDNQARRTMIYWIFAGIIIILVGVKLFSILTATIEISSDLFAYTVAAENLRNGHSIYWLPIRGGIGIKPNYLYPPFLALFFLPFHSDAFIWRVWVIFSITCWIGALLLILQRLRPALNQRLSASSWPLLVVGLTAFLPFINHILWGQVALPILLCLVCAWLCLERGWDYRAGMLIGVTIAIKVYPVLLVIPLLLGRRWRAAVATIGCAAILSAGSFAVIGVDQTLFYLQKVLPAVGNHARGNLGNYALRELMPVPIAYGIGLLALGVTVQVARQRKVIEAFMLTICLILLVSPVVWAHYMVLVALPWLYALAHTTTRRQIGVVLVAFVAVANASAVYYAPQWIYQLLHWLPMLGVIILTIVLTYQSLAQPNRRDEAGQVAVIHQRDAAVGRHL